MSGTEPGKIPRAAGNWSSAEPPRSRVRVASTRPLALLASGRRHGRITRLITPWNIGELTTPFVFLDYAEVEAQAPLLGIQPHSSIATVTVVLNGALSFRDAAGAHGKVAAGGFAWMNAAHAVWHGAAATGEPLRVFQLWIALPPSPLIPAIASEAISPLAVQQEGPVSVILGQFGRARSAVRSAPAGINCLRVTLKDGQRWRYTAPEAHNVTWLALDRGGLTLQEGEWVRGGQIAVFGDSGGVIEARADGDTSFVLGSARRQPPLALNDFPASVAALVQVQPQAQGLAPRLTGAAQ